MLKDKENKTTKYSFKQLSEAFVKFWKLLKPDRLKVVLVIFLSLVLSLLGMVYPKIFAIATNEMFYGINDYISGVGGINYNNLLWILILCLLIYITLTILSLIQGYISVAITRALSYRLKDQLARKITRLSISEYEILEKGDVLARMSNDISIVQNSVLTMFSGLLKNFVLMICSLVMMLSIDWVLTLIVVVSLPIILFISWIGIKISQKYYIMKQKTFGSINAYIDEFFSGQTLVQAYNKQKETIDEFKTINNKLYSQNVKASIFSSLLSPLISILQNSVYIIIILYGAAKILSGALTLGDVQAFLQYKSSFEGPISSWIGLMDQIQQTLAAYERYEKFMEKDEEIDMISEPNSSNIETKSLIKFDNVSFSYNKDKQVINNVSLDINEGDTVAIVGPTGAGKTTLIKLLLRFYDANKGNIYIDGKNIKSLKPSEVRDNYAVVLQSVWLFNASIKDNIKYGNQDANDEEVITAAKYASCDEFINAFKYKYDTQISERSSNLSYGQKQLISIARAILANKNILILDEATSSVDSATETKLYDAFDEIIENHTSIVIAHRLSTVKKADKIIVINDGEIVEQGSHESLMENKSFYYNLYKIGLDTKSK